MARILDQIMSFRVGGSSKKYWFQRRNRTRCYTFQIENDDCSHTMLVNIRQERPTGVDGSSRSSSTRSSDSSAASMMSAPDQLLVVKPRSHRDVNVTEETVFVTVLSETKYSGLYNVVDMDRTFCAAANERLTIPAGISQDRSKKVKFTYLDGELQLQHSIADL